MMSSYPESVGEAKRPVMEALTLGLGPSIADNSLGTVYRGIWKGRAVCVQSCDKLTSAVSTGLDYGPTEYESIIGEFSRNLDRMREWKDKHPNVAAVHGVVKDPVNHTPKYIIYDFATSSLERCLRDSSKSVTVTRWKRVWQQLFLGLAHLHGKSPPVIHGNIEPNTVVARTYQDGSTLLWLNAGLGSWRQALSLNSPIASIVSSKDARDGVLSFFRPPECSGQRGQVLDTLQAGLQADVYTAALLAAYLFLEFVVLPSTKSEKEHSLFENFKLNSDSTGATTTRPVSLGVRTVTETVDSVLAWLRSHKGCEQLADVLQLCLDKHPHNRPSAQDVCKALELFDESCLLAADGGPSKEEIMEVSAELVLKQRYDAVVAAERALLQALKFGSASMRKLVEDSQPVHADTAYFLPGKELDRVIMTTPLKDVAVVVPAAKLPDDSCEIHKQVLRILRRVGSFTCWTRADEGAFPGRGKYTALSGGSSPTRSPYPSPEPPVPETQRTDEEHIRDTCGCKFPEEGLPRPWAPPNTNLTASHGSQENPRAAEGHAACRDPAAHGVTSPDLDVCTSMYWDRLRELESAYEDLKAAQTVAAEANVPATGKHVGDFSLNNCSSNVSLDVSVGGQYIVASNGLIGCVAVYRNPSLDVVAVVWDVDGAPLRTPGSVCFTQPGRVLVVEQEAKRLRELSYEGKHIRLFGTGVAFDLQISGLAFSGTSVAVSHYAELLLFDYLSGVLLHKFGREGGAVGDLWGCHGVAFTPDSRSVLVADGSNHRIAVFTTDGSEAWCFGMNQLHFPRDVCVLPNGSFAVADSGNSAIVVFSPDGKRILRRFPSFGNELEGATLPTALCFDNVHRQLFVLEDMGTLRVFE